jgi:serine/threonine-protein kinase
VLLTPDDFAYLVDFGIARVGGDTGLTSTGSAIGSSAYMAPERFTDGKVGPPADVYSLTCLLYETLTGEPPFATDDLTRLMSAHILSPPPRPSEVQPNIERAFDAVIAWGMAKDPVERCPTAGELARAAASAAAPQASPRETIRNRPVTPRAANDASRGTPSRPGVSGRALIAVVVAGVVVLTTAAVTVLWLMLSKKDNHIATPPITVTSRPLPVTETRTASPPSATVTTVVPPRIILPGTDALGFVAYPAARCDPGQIPVAMGLTAQSAVVVCRTESGSFFYRGVRLKDGAGIELGNAVPSSRGFDVANPSDGTLYQVRSNALTIITPDGEVHSEPMAQYASSQ